MIVQTGMLEGIFTGYHDIGCCFRFTDGTVWQQAEEKQASVYLYQPLARVIYQSGTCYLEVSGMEELVSVKRAHDCQL